MIYVTGDTHGLHDFEKLLLFSLFHPDMTYDDYVIICGDFGAIWGDNTEALLDHFSKFPFTVLFVDGNHEDFNRLNSYPIHTWKGGNVHIIRENIIHLMRGQVFSLDGNTIFTFGGAESHDKEYRIYGKNIWEQEIPCMDDIHEAEKNLDKVKWKVDYVITHSCDTNSLHYSPIPLNRQEEMQENRILSKFSRRLQYNHWYFGHYHRDGNINDKETVLYQKIIPLGHAV